MTIYEYMEEHPYDDLEGYDDDYREEAPFTYDEITVGEEYRIIDLILCMEETNERGKVFVELDNMATNQYITIHDYDLQDKDAKVLNIVVDGREIFVELEVL